MTIATNRVSWDIPKEILLPNKKLSLDGHQPVYGSNVEFLANVSTEQIVITQRDHFDNTVSKLVLERDKAAFDFRNPNDYIKNGNPYSLSKHFFYNIVPKGFPNFDPELGLPTSTEICNSLSKINSNSRLTTDSLVAAHYQGCLDVLALLHTEAQRAKLT